MTAPLSGALLTIFDGIALTPAAISIYGITPYLVAQRTQEMRLGSASALLWLVALARHQRKTRRL